MGRDESGTIGRTPIAAKASPPEASLLRPQAWQPGESPLPPPPATAYPLLLLIDCPAARAATPQNALLACLSAPERHRHAALRRPPDQQRFLMGRAALRQLLGHWLKQPPAAVAIAAGSHGKPHCTGAPAFNLSHSGDLILLAFHRAGEVGVDVERARPNLDWQPIARRVFPPAELEALEGLPAGAQAGAFLQTWCRLEARLKARGEGLAGLERLRQSRLRVGLGSSEPAEMEHLWDVVVPQGYAAAVALRSPIKGPPVAVAGACHPSPPV